MLLIARKMNEFSFAKLMEVYRQANREHGKRLAPEENEYRQLQLSEEDYYSYLQDSFFNHPGAVYCIFYFILILAFSYFYAAIQFNPVEIANNLKKNGGFIPGFRPGRPTSDFITKALGKVTFLGAIFLSIVAGVPLIVGALNSSMSSIALGGTSVLIVVGVALETVRQLESQLMMRNYKGFLE